MLDKGFALSRRQPDGRVTSRLVSLTCLTLLAVLIACARMTHAGEVRASQSTAYERHLKFERLVTELKGAVISERLARVNAFFNALPYRADAELWGVRDYWTTPAELLEKGAGDCEDLATAKYFALRRLGVPARALRLTYMRDARRGRPHVSLIYRSSDGGAVLLDSAPGAPRSPALRPDLVPVFGFNERRVIVPSPDGAERSFTLAGRWLLTGWASVLSRIPTAASALAARTAILRP